MVFELGESQERLLILRREGWGEGEGGGGGIGFTDMVQQCMNSVRVYYMHTYLAPQSVQIQLFQTD